MKCEIVLNIFYRKKGDYKVCVFIRMQDLAAYSLVEELKKNDSKREFTFGEIEKYGLFIEKYFKSENEPTVYLTTEPYRREFCNDYSDCFKYRPATDTCPETIILHDDVTIDTIREKMVSHMPIRMLEIISTYNPAFFENAA